jgi:hypothetical protein
MREINQWNALLEGAFTFLAKDTTLECSIGQAVALPPAVRTQLSVDARAHTSALKDVGVVDSIRCLLSCGRLPMGLELILMTLTFNVTG